jgi:hypothetical protein
MRTDIVAAKEHDLASPPLLIVVMACADTTAGTSSINMTQENMVWLRIRTPWMAMNSRSLGRNQLRPAAAAESSTHASASFWSYFFGALPLFPPTRVSIATLNAGSSQRSP